ncbi:MAG: TonB-dependent receptor, partial [Bacteroidia bacterium]|nr:TonB-dependent receptor [Bacteroidia bacterium]
VELLNTGRIVPVYSLTEGLYQRSLRALTAQVVKYWAPRYPDPLPTDMVERVEVVRGAASALYGAGAVAGIVNLVSRRPVLPEAHVSLRQAWTGAHVPESAVSACGAWANERKGATGFGVFRRRTPFDANGDGFSERTALTTAALGAKAAFRPRPESQWTADLYGLYENRRGGSDFALAPHEARTAEALEHRIVGGAGAYERLSRDLRRRFSAYCAFQDLRRRSYYGNAPMIAAGLDPYGRSREFSSALGTQLFLRLGKRDATTATFGVEWNRNEVYDRTGGVLVAGAPRTFRQNNDNAGSYALLETAFGSRWTIQWGLRADLARLRLEDGLYRFGETRVFGALNPRLSAIYKPAAKVRLRAGYGMGFRPPQAFDEDLHLAVVAGEVQSRRLAADLRPERSHSFYAEAVAAPQRGRWTTEVAADVFYTRLVGAFVYTTAEPGVWEKRNGAGASVVGTGLRLTAAWGDKLWAEANVTALSARNDVPVEWGGPEPEARFLRTPAFYGSGACRFVVFKGLALSLTAVFTGSMLAPRFSPFEHGDVPDDEPYRHLLPARTELLATPAFLDLHPKASYRIEFRRAFYVEPYVGVFNVLNAYQRDFGYGLYRDPNYVYGPERPITPYAGLKAGWK